VTLPRTLLIATQNQGKLRELEEMLSDLPYRLISLSEYPEIKAITEIGNTFTENACMKAQGYAQQTRLLTLADDSGLEVHALGGAPGVRSARYAGEGASDEARATKLLGEMTAFKGAHRRARFVCVIALSDAAGSIVHTATGVCEGQIAEKPSGTGGFGYDPVFLPNGYEKTFAELSASTKNQISHRASALVQTHNFLRVLTDSSVAG
jgi:XTP/dITP diphosphohydrolase